MSIMEWLGLGKNETAPRQADRPAVSQTETVRRIVDELNNMEPERARFIAAFAYILGRVARADLEISEEETREMERIVMAQGGLPEEQALIVVQIAKIHNELFGHTEDFLVTREYAQNATLEEKKALLDCLFAVSASDRSISSMESTEIRSIADELHLSQRDYAQARSRYRKYLAELQHGEEEPEAE